MFDDKGTFPHESESDSEENMINDSKTKYNEVYLAKRVPKYYKEFEEIESVGSEILFYIVYLGWLSGTVTQSAPLDILTKGRNNRCAYHTDLQNMYNRVLLEPQHWCYQLYYFQKELDPDEVPKTKAIKTLIYGVKPSGNQAKRGIRETADLQRT